jgi:hypothetical protein
MPRQLPQRHAFHRTDHRAHGAAVVGKQRDRLAGADGGLQQRSGAGPGCRDQICPRNTLGGLGRLWRHARSRWPGAYTVFANGGVKIDPWLLASIRSASGDVLNDYPANSKPILDPRVAYLTLALMENVINAGTAQRSLAWLHRPCGRQNRHLARCMVRRVYQQPALRGVDRQ